MWLFKVKSYEKNLQQHLNDLRKHLIIAFVYFVSIFIIVFYNSKHIYYILLLPLNQTLNYYQVKAVFIVTSLPEGFITYIKMSLWISLIILAPIIIWHIYCYAFSIIKKDMRYIFLMVIILSPLLFYLGNIVAYFVFFKVIWGFFVKFSLAQKLGLYLKISEYVSLALKIMVCVGICFQLPIICFILNKVGVVSLEQLKSKRKIMILIAFIIAAIITPPDPFSQTIMALMLIFLYELSLIMIKITNNYSKTTAVN